jgi:TPR repeat protein
MTVSTGKLFLIAILTSIAVLLGTFVLTLQIVVIQRQQQLKILEKKRKKGRSTKQQNSIQSTTYDSNRKISHKEEEENSISTIKTSIPTKDIKLWTNTIPDGVSKSYAANAYWKQVQEYLGAIGDVSGIRDDDYTSEFIPPSSHIHTSLLKASKYGNSNAQHYEAVALASGIWLTGHPSQNQTITDDFSVVPPEAMLLWYMASIDGNVEAMMALANRINMTNTLCSASLPYYEAAAHIIMDELEADKQSRAKISPPMDKHNLPEIHLHGGTSSQLGWDNKPDESHDAIQYYHLLSTRQADPDIQAAYTLANLYHFGLRGVSQNLTKALEYYTIAADAGNWEAAGQAGKFHFWSLGMEPSQRDLFKAQKLFQKGAQFGLEGCQERYRLHLKRKKSKSDSNEEIPVELCDHPSLNGLGLLYLYGIPTMKAIDLGKARAFFQLSRDMGNMDAAYNLAMLKLGFNAGWKEVSTSFTGSNGGSKERVPAFMDKSSSFPSRQNWTDAVHDLLAAAGKGHIQAHHRLAMIYQHGIQVGANAYVGKDCKKASKHYQSIINKASPYLSKRTRMAYKQYMSGDYEGALVNYLMAAETGHSLSQVNAAFLLSQGVCLHLTSQQCRQASLRFWKAATFSGDQEAALRVGDFYYYGTKRKPTLLDIVIYPEIHLLPVLTEAIQSVKEYTLSKFLGVSQRENSKLDDVNDVSSSNEICGWNDNNQNNDNEKKNTCPNPSTSEQSLDSDLEKAAQYYRLASERFKSARANFNLGFMHEWGLGLKQDFPLAKRYYDLAKTSPKHATLPVQLALMSMKVHEWFVTLRQSLFLRSEPSNDVVSEL